MTMHQHDFVETTAGSRCRFCGRTMEELMEDSIEIIHSGDSGRKARRVLEHIAVTGEYTAIGMKNGFVIYTRNRDGITEELYIEKPNSRSFQVVKLIKASII